jgi:hypothetical protein
LEIDDPGAGNQWIFTLPQVSNLWRYKILALSFYFSTDATVINRSVGLRFFRHGGAYTWWRLFVPQVQAASQAFDYMFALGLPAAPWWAGGVSIPVSNHIFCPLPDFELTNWERMGFSTGNQQAGDNCVNIHVLIRRWQDDSN